MTTYMESLFCQDTNEVPEELFEGQKCITKSSGFRMICLEKPVLHALLSTLNHSRGGSMENLDNGLYRFAGYNQFTFWCMIILRKVFAKSFTAFHLSTVDQMVTAISWKLGEKKNQVMAQSLSGR